MSKIYKILVEKICKIITIFGQEKPCEREAGESRTFLVQKLTSIETKRNLNWVVLFDRWVLQERERNAAFIKRRSSRVTSDVRSVDSLHSFITILCTRPLPKYRGEVRGEAGSTGHCAEWKSLKCDKVTYFSMESFVLLRFLVRHVLSLMDIAHGKFPMIVGL